MKKFRKLSLKSKYTPDLSLTPQGLMFKAFDEKEGSPAGNYSYTQLLRIGFSNNQLQNIRKKGTTNFKIKKKGDK